MEKVKKGYFFQIQIKFPNIFKKKFLIQNSRKFQIFSIIRNKFQKTKKLKTETGNSEKWKPEKPKSKFFLP